MRRFTGLLVLVALLGSGCSSSRRAPVERRRAAARACSRRSRTRRPTSGSARGSSRTSWPPPRSRSTRSTPGTEAGVALLSGSIDASYMGPWPAISLFLQSGKVAVVSGVAVGGASLVIRRGANIASPDDLRGKRIAVPNVGNTQDIALRTWLHEQGLEATDEGATSRSPRRIARSSSSCSAPAGSMVRGCRSPTRPTWWMRVSPTCSSTRPISGHPEGSSRPTSSCRRSTWTPTPRWSADSSRRRRRDPVRAGPAAPRAGDRRAPARLGRRTSDGYVGDRGSVGEAHVHLGAGSRRDGAGRAGRPRPRCPRGGSGARARDLPA